jgi:hypothetical protein
MGTPAQTCRLMVADCAIDQAQPIHLSDASARLLVWWWRLDEESPTWSPRLTAFSPNGTGSTIYLGPPAGPPWDYKQIFAAVARKGKCWSIEPDYTTSSVGPQVPAALYARSMLDGTLLGYRQVDHPGDEWQAIVADDKGERLWAFWNRQLTDGGGWPYTLSYWQELNTVSLAGLGSPQLLDFSTIIDPTDTGTNHQGWNFVHLNNEGWTYFGEGNVAFDRYDGGEPIFAAVAVDPSTWDTSPEDQLFRFRVDIEATGTLHGGPIAPSIGSTRIFRRLQASQGYIAWGDGLPIGAGDGWLQHLDD